MNLNLTNLKDLQYICQIAEDSFEPRVGTANETEWLTRISLYRQLIQAEIERTQTQNEEPLQVDPQRINRRQTDIFVRAVYQDGTFGSVDISELSKESLFTWLRSRGGDNLWAENTVALLLGWFDL